MVRCGVSSSASRYLGSVYPHRPAPTRPPMPHALACPNPIHCYLGLPTADLLRYDYTTVACR